MDFNKDDFIAAIKDGQPYSAGGVEARFRDPDLTRVQLVTLDGRHLAYVAPAVSGEGITVHWTLRDHDALRAAEIINAIGGGLLGRPLVRLIDGQPHRVRFDGNRLWKEAVEMEGWVRASSVYGAES